MYVRVMHTCEYDWYSMLPRLSLVLEASSDQSSRGASEMINYKQFRLEKMINKAFGLDRLQS